MRLATYLRVHTVAQFLLILTFDIWKLSRQIFYFVQLKQEPKNKNNASNPHRYSTMRNRVQIGVKLHLNPDKFPGGIR